MGMADFAPARDHRGSHHADTLVSGRPPRVPADEITAISRALDEACKALNINGDARHREAIAARIIDLARNGVIDSKALSERIVAESKAMRSL